MFDHTLKMKVDNTGFLVDRLGKDCAPLQYIRELTQNAIEAIARAGRAEGHIVWQADTSWTDGGAPKLSITDNGDGMTGEEMVRYINTLSCNGSGRQALDGNFGVGAKIAAATRNPHGLVYLSWKANDGAAIKMVRDTTGQYGLEAFGDVDETGYIAEVPDPQPEIVARYGSGTKIVLLGDHSAHDTCAAPQDAGTSSAQWVRRYLNTRYFRVPANIKIQCQDFAKDGSGGLRYVSGQGPMLDAVAICKGTAALKDAIAHWWALPEVGAALNPPVQIPGTPKTVNSMQSFGPSHVNYGHVALLFKNELYDLSIGPSAYAKLHQCGIFFGTNRIVIYFEPTSKDIIVNTARTQLIIHGAPPPWTEWATEFRSRMPRALSDFIDSIEANKGPRDNSAIKSRIQEVLTLFQVTKYRSEPSGTVDVANADEDAAVGGGAEGCIPASGEPASPGPKSPRPRPISTRVLKPKGTKAKPFEVADLPKTIWKWTNNGTRSPMEMEDKAAQYEPTTNTLFINGDFRGFQAWIRFFEAQYPETPNARTIIREEMESWWEMTLVEAVVAYYDYRSSPHWTPNMPQLTDEALTLAVLPRYHLHNALKRGIRTRLGQPQREVGVMAVEPASTA